MIRPVLRSELLNHAIKLNYGISRTLGHLAILCACLPGSIHILAPTLGASSAHTLSDISQSGDIRSICAEDYGSLQPYWNPKPNFFRASNRAAWETWFQRTRDTLTVARLDYFELGRIPEEEGSGAGRSPSDTADFQEFP